MGVTQGQTILVYPRSPLGHLWAASRFPPGHSRVTLGCPWVLPNSKVVLCNKLFLAWLFFCEMDYSSVICNNTLVYIRGYGRSAGVRKAGLGQQWLGGASRGTTNSKSRFSGDIDRQYASRSQDIMQRYLLALEMLNR